MTGAWWSSLKGGGGTMVRRHEDGMAVVVWWVGADTRPRKERRGRWIARACSHEGGREGKEKGGHGGDRVPFIFDMAGGGDGPRAVPHDDEAWAGVGPARRGRQRLGRGTHGRRAHRRRTTGAEIGEGGG
jgi:hypothetical protein